jgi:heptosyltransferase-2
VETIPFPAGKILMIDVRILRRFDRYVLGAVTLVLGPAVKLLSSGRDPVSLRKVLLIKLWAIGDSVLTLPLIRAIRERYPDSEIDVLCHPSNRPVFENTDGAVSNVVEIGIRNVLRLFRKYDVCFDTEPYLNLSAILSAYCAGRRVGFRNRLRWLFYHHTVDTDLNRHAVEKYLEMGTFFGITGRNRLVPLGGSTRSREAAERLLRENGITTEGAPVGFCAAVGNSVKARQWPRERFRELAKRILDDGTAGMAVLFGTAEDRELNGYIRDGDPRIVDLSGKATLEETFSLIRSMNAFVSNDTGPMHIAAAQGVPTLGLFGPSCPELWAPYGKGNRHISHGRMVCEYCPCNVPHKGLVPECYLEGDRKDVCIRAITVEEAYRTLREILPT